MVAAVTDRKNGNGEDERGNEVQSLERRIEREWLMGKIE